MTTELVNVTLTTLSAVRKYHRWHDNGQTCYHDGYNKFGKPAVVHGVPSPELTDATAVVVYPDGSVTLDVEDPYEVLGVGFLLNTEELTVPQQKAEWLAFLSAEGLLPE